MTVAIILHGLLTVWSSRNSLPLFSPRSAGVWEYFLRYTDRSITKYVKAPIKRGIPSAILFFLVSFSERWSRQDMPCSGRPVMIRKTRMADGNTYMSCSCMCTLRSTHQPFTYYDTGAYRFREYNALCLRTSGGLQNTVSTGLVGFPLSPLENSVKRERDETGSLAFGCWNRTHAATMRDGHNITQP